MSSKVDAQLAGADSSALVKKAGSSTIDARRSKEALQSGSSSIGSLSGKIPPQRPPPPSPAALSKVSTRLCNSHNNVIKFACC